MDQASRPASPIQDENYDQTLKLLRCNWKWAAASDFLYKFNPMLHLDYLDLSDVEYDLIRGTSENIFSVFVKILHVLTSIRGLSMDSWEMYLRRLYARRVPENLVWGTENEPIGWTDLGWENRLEILYTLCEWEFQSPMKVRQAMKDDSDDASWRSMPIGRDSKRNLYWRFGRDRLWIQRHVEKTVPERPLKRKKHPTKPTPKNSKRKPTLNGGNKTTKPAAKEKGSSQKKPTQRVTSGTRVSSRLARGSLSDGWQKVPDDWLGDSPKKPQNGSVDDKPNVSSLFDDASDLTDLSDEDSKQASVRESPKSGGNSDFDSDLTDSEDDADENDVKENGVDGIKAAASTADHGPFIEFETICVTITEWRDFAENFKGVRSHNERRMFRYITEAVIPELEGHQQALEEKQRNELKEMQRREQAAAAAAAAEARPKRSTRLAALAVEEEKARQESGSSIDGDYSDVPRGHSSRGRRAAARSARWRREQDEFLAEAIGEEDDGDVEMERRERKSFGKIDQDDYQEQEESDEVRPVQIPVNGMGRPRRAAAVAADQKRPFLRARRRRVKSDTEDDEESEEPFFLSCEICKKSGWNEDDGRHLISCKMCGIWQHMTCHDINDKRLGQPKRDWSNEQFLCSTCQVKMQTQRTRRGRKPKPQEGDGADLNMTTEPETQSDLHPQSVNPTPPETIPSPASGQVVSENISNTAAAALAPPDLPVPSYPLHASPITTNEVVMDVGPINDPNSQANQLTQLPTQYTWQPPVMSQHYQNHQIQSDIGANQQPNQIQTQLPPLMQSVPVNGLMNGTQQLNIPILPPSNSYYSPTPNGPNGYTYPPQ